MNDSLAYLIPLVHRCSCWQAAGARAEAAGLKSQVRDLQTRLENETARLQSDVEASRQRLQEASTKVTGVSLRRRPRRSWLLQLRHQHSMGNTDVRNFIHGPILKVCCSDDAPACRILNFSAPNSKRSCYAAARPDKRPCTPGNPKVQSLRREKNVMLLHM